MIQGGIPLRLDIHTVATPNSHYGNRIAYPHSEMTDIDGIYRKKKNSGNLLHGYLKWT